MNKENWTRDDMFQWIVHFFIPNNPIDEKLFRIEAYRDINGKKLINMKTEDFEKLDPYYGRLLCSELNNFHSNTSNITRFK